MVGIISGVSSKARKVLTNSAVTCCIVKNLLPDGGEIKFFTEPPVNTRTTEEHMPPSHESPHWWLCYHFAASV